MQVMVVNGNRYLINPESKACDSTCERILEQYPKDAVVEFEEPKLKDVL